MEKDYYLHLSQDKREYLRLPKGWIPLHFVEAEEEAIRASIDEMTHEALSKPTGTPPFQQMLSGVKSIAIIVDDATRPTPVAMILKALLSHLLDNGFWHEKINIVVALGTHEAMKREALEVRFFMW
jgi:nickel-dependent lactate racemase